MDVLVVAIAVVAALAGLVFTVVPILPGALLVLAGAIAAGAVGGFDGFSTAFWVGQVLLVVTSFLVDNGAQALGVKRLGGSRLAMLGGVVGTIAGPFALAPLLGPFALLLGPPLGAVSGVLLGEWQHRRRADLPGMERPEVTRFGIATLVTWAVSTTVRLVLVGIQGTWLVLAVV